jgi:AAA domain
MTTPGIPGPKVLLMGDSGTGKTHALRTLVEAGITPFVIFTEPGQETLGDLPDGKWHYKYIPPATQGWGAILDMAKKVNQLTLENLSKVTDVNKSKFEGLLQVITACNDFKCDCHGTSFGDVAKWSTDRALCLDSLSGLSDMAMAHTVGGKPVRSQSDWGIAQNMVRMILMPLTTATQCTFVLIGHLAREYNEVTGGSNVMVSTLGQKLAPDIPRMFSDVINTVRVGTNFTWDTSSGSMAVKARNVPIAKDLPPSFVPLLKEWQRKGGRISPTA